MIVSSQDINQNPGPNAGYLSRSGLISLLLILFFLMLGDFLGISQISPTINYNYLNGSFLYTAAGLLFAWAALRREKPDSGPDNAPHWLPLLLIGAGFFTGFDFFVKFSSSVIFFGLAGLFVLLQQSGPIRQRIQPVLPLGLGYLAGIAAFFLFIYPLQDWLKIFHESFSTQTGGTHNPFRIINKQIGDFKRIGTNLGTYYLLPLAALFFLSRKFLRKAKSNWWVVLPITLLLNGLVAYNLYKLTNFRFHTLFFLATMLILLTTHLGIGNRTLFSSARRNIGLLIMLLLPFLLIFGSDSSFSYSIPLYLLPWFGVIFILIRHLPGKALQVSTLATLVLLAEAQFLAGYLYYPWRWVENRLAQTETLRDVKGLEGIQVDKPTRRFIEESQAIVNLLPATNRKWMIGFYELPGIVYALGGKSPGLPWYSMNKHEQMHVCKSLKEASATVDLKRTMLLMQDEIHPRLQPCATELGLETKNYRKAGEVYNPYSKKPIAFYVRPEASSHAD